MPTIPPPSNSPRPQVVQSPPAPPPNPLSPTQQSRNTDTTLSVVLFIIALLVLCSLIGIFIAKSTQTYRLETPTLSNLPENTNRNTVTIEGIGPKKANIEISSESKSFATTSDKEGKFSLTVETGPDGKVTYFAIARKKILFFSFESTRSNEVFTTVDKTSPNMKIVSLPKTVTTSKYTIKGSTSEPAKVVVKINQSEHIVDTDKDNNFSLPLSLAKGINFVTVTAKDRAGNETSSAALTTTYATGSVYVPGSTNGKPLPNSAGNLPAALDTAFGRIIAIAAVILGILGFAASSSVVWLVKLSRREV